MKGLVMGAVLAVGCGSVEKQQKDDAAIIDTPAIDAAADAAGDAMGDAGLNCMTDNFDGAALASHWTVTAGAMPTYTVASGKLTITDSPQVTTPSNTNESWINDITMDKGNSLGWAHAIGGGDFILRSHLDWSSDNNQLMISAIAVLDNTGKIAAMIGAYDGGQGGIALLYTKILSTTGEMSQTGAMMQPGSVDLRIERTNSTLKTFVGSTELISNTVNVLITHVGIVHVPYRQNANSYEFGTAEWTFVELCR